MSGRFCSRARAVVTGRRGVTGGELALTRFEPRVRESDVTRGKVASLSLRATLSSNHPLRPATTARQRTIPRHTLIRATALHTTTVLHAGRVGSFALITCQWRQTQNCENAEREKR